MMAVPRIVLVLFLPSVFAASGCFDTDEDPNAPLQYFISIGAEPSPPAVWIRWNETAPGEARDLVGQAFEHRMGVHEPEAEFFVITERQVGLVKDYLHSEWLKAGRDPDLGSPYPIQYADTRARIGISVN